MSSDTFNIVNPPQIEMELVSVIQASSNQANDGAINIDVKDWNTRICFLSGLRMEK